MNKPILIKGGRIVDPVNERDEVADLFIMEGLIAPRPSDLPDDTQVLEASGLVVTPGLIDIHVHLREPGRIESETIKTGSKAAARGGFTTIVPMPNTTPPLDTPERIKEQIDKGKADGYCRVLPSAAITRGREGYELGDLQALVEAGAVALTDDGMTVIERETMKQAMQMAADLEVPLMDHAEDRKEKHDGVMHDGKFAKMWGLPGLPAYLESRIVLRNAELAEETGCPVHIQHVSSVDSIEIIRRFRTRGVPITGEVTPHHLMLTDEEVDPEDACFKMNPPLRSARDRESLQQAVIDGTIEAFATDHAPHSKDLKDKGFLKAPFGVVGLETAVGVTYTCMVASGLMELNSWVKRWTAGPARILGIDAPSLQAGRPADVTVLDLESEWRVKRRDFFSKSTNTPFSGMTLTGRAVFTICNGSVTWSER